MVSAIVVLLLSVVVCSLALVAVINPIGALKAIIGNFEKGAETMKKFIENVVKMVVAVVKAYYYNVVSVVHSTFSVVRDWWRKGKKYELYLYYFTRRAERNFRISLRHKKEFWNKTKNLILPSIWQWLVTKRNINYFAFLCNQRGSIGIGILSAIVTVAGNNNAYHYSIIRECDYETLIEKDGNSNNFGGTHIEQQLACAIEGIKHAIKYGMSKIKVYYAFDGVKNWAVGDWKAKTPVAQWYKGEITKLSQLAEIEFVYNTTVIPRSTISKKDIEKEENKCASLEINDKWKKAKKVIEEGESLFVHGKAGTGKSTFLKWLKDCLADKNFLILAPTGIAAINVGGRTIHSAFRLGWDNKVPENKFIISNKRKNKYADIELADIIVIDEVSMVRCDLMNTIDTLLRKIMNNDKIFGGKQMIFMGDLYQLPPFVKEQDKSEYYKHYKGLSFLYANIFETCKIKRVEFEKIYRQKGDMKFTNLLNNIRTNENPEKIKEFINNIKPIPTHDPDSIILNSHNETADKINREKLQAIQSPEITLTCVSDSCLSEEETIKLLNSYQMTPKMIVKKGTKILTVVNRPKLGFMNGTICTIDDVKYDVIYATKENGERIEISRFKFPGKHYNRFINQMEDVFVSMYPIKLAWAISIHKSQGQTFNKMNLDMNGAFAPGQLYVALSRCRTLEGIRFIQAIQQNMVIVDKGITKLLNEKTINIDNPNPTPIIPEPPKEKTEIVEEVIEEIGEEVEAPEIIEVQDISEEESNIPVEKPIQENKIVVKEEVKMEQTESKVLQRVIEALETMNDLGYLTFMEGKKGKDLSEIIDNIVNFYEDSKVGVKITDVNRIRQCITYGGIMKIKCHTKHTLAAANELLPVFKDYISKGMLEKVPEDMLEKILKSLNDFMYGAIQPDFIIEGQNGHVERVKRDTFGSKAANFGFEFMLKGYTEEVDENGKKTITYNDCKKENMKVYEKNTNLPKMINVFENKDMYRLYMNTIIFTTSDTKYVRGRTVELTNDALIKFLIPMMKKFNLTFASAVNEQVLYIMPKDNNIENEILDGYKIRKEFNSLAINKKVARFTKFLNGRTRNVSLQDAVISETFPEIYKKLEGKEGVIYIDKEFMDKNGIKNGDKIMKYGKSLIHGIQNLKSDFGIDVIFPKDENKLKISLELIKELGLFIWSYRAEDASKEEKDAASIWALLSLGVIDIDSKANEKQADNLRAIITAFYKRDIDGMLKLISFKKDNEDVEDNVVKALTSGNYTTTLLQVIEKKIINRLRKTYQNFEENKIMARVMPLEALYVDGGSRQTRNMKYGSGLIIRYPCHHFIFGSFVYDMDAKIVYVNSDLWMHYTGGDFDGDLVHVFEFNSYKDVVDMNKNKHAGTNYVYDYNNPKDRATMDKYFQSVKTESFAPKSDYYENLEISYINILNNQKNIGEAFRMAMIFRQMISYFYGEQDAVNASLTLNTTLVQRAIDSIKHNDNFKKECIFSEFKTFLEKFNLDENEIDMRILTDYVNRKETMNRYLMYRIPYISEKCNVTEKNVKDVEKISSKWFWKGYLFSIFNKVISLATKETNIRNILRFVSNTNNDEGLCRIVRLLQRDLTKIGFNMLNFIQRSKTPLFDDVVLLDKEDIDEKYERSYIDIKQNDVITRYEIQFIIHKDKLVIKKDHKFGIIMKLFSKRNLFVGKKNGTYIMSSKLPKNVSSFGIQKVEFTNPRLAEAFEHSNYTNPSNLEYGKVTYTINGSTNEWIKTGEIPSFYKAVAIALKEDKAINELTTTHRKIQTDIKFRYVGRFIKENICESAIKDMLEQGATIFDIENTIQR